MKLASLALGVLALTGTVRAGMYTFTPNPADLYDLDHHTAVAWGVTGTDALQSQLANGYRISGATITIDKIWDWKKEDDMLFINLLDDPKNGVQSYTDNTADNVISNYFNGSGGNKWQGSTALTTWSDPNGGSAAGAINYSYTFGIADLAVLTSYLTDPTLNGKAAFGLGFDPDCHYYNDGIKLIIYTEKIPTNVPDSGSSVVLLTLGLAACAYARRRFSSLRS
ncbi:MAG: VPDSG-CTERM sorting domain-containing protein [Opitutaceae bacterium]